MKKSKRLENYRNIFKLNWRIAWYGVFVWVLSLILSSIVLLPWFYIVFPVAILVVTKVYFKKSIVRSRLRDRFKGTVFAQGLSAGFFWFFSIFIFDFVQFVGLDFSGAGVYFLDPRNFIKYPIVMLVPMIYGLVLENNNSIKTRAENEEWIASGVMRLHA